MARKTENMSIIDSGMTFEGTMSSQGTLIIKGIVKGRIEGEHIIIAKEGLVTAECHADSVVIGGSYDGDLKVKGVMKILSTGKCSGKVSCKDIVVENGSTLNASVDCSFA